MPRKVQNPPEFVPTDKCTAMDLKKMETDSLNRMLLDRIQELERKGLVDHNFRQCYLLKEISSLTFFLDLILVFLDDVHTVVRAMAKTLTQPVVNYDEMYSHHIKLKGSSSCIGACRIKDACFKIRHAIESNSKDGCLQVLNVVHNEYKSLHEQFDGVIKIERELVSRGTRQAS
ncbi:hypothetical protein ABFX02_06G088100 [Erythranthe guttata]